MTDDIGPLEPTGPFITAALICEKLLQEQKVARRALRRTKVLQNSAFASDVVHRRARRLDLLLGHRGHGRLGQHPGRGLGGVEEHARGAAAERAVE
jgi:hypothetical protein